MVNDLKIKNFGPIKSADFSIAPLTIFIGSNASGKSYAALLMHSLLNPFDRNVDSQLNSVKSLEYLLDEDEGLYNEFNDDFINYLGSGYDFSEMSFEFPSDKFDRLLESGVGRFYSQSVEKKAEK